jgi:hypothetical protein
VLPKREFKNVEDFELHVENAEELIFDGTENLTERPKEYDKQKEKYSGKKGTHTDLALLLSDKKTWIYYVSNYYDGKNVDFGVLKQEFPPELPWFKRFKVLVDLGFIGIAKLYEIKELIIGEKKPRKSKKNLNSKLTEEQKIKNTAVSKQRIFVEHAIGKMKRYRILKNRCRIKCPVTKNRILGIAAGLWNYQLALNN